MVEEYFKFTGPKLTFNTYKGSTWITNPGKEKVYCCPLLLGSSIALICARKMFKLLIYKILYVTERHWSSLFFTDVIGNGSPSRRFVVVERNAPVLAGLPLLQKRSDSIDHACADQAL